jgi:hypothetical protein
MARPAVETANALWNHSGDTCGTASCFLTLLALRWNTPGEQGGFSKRYLAWDTI